MGRNEGLEDYTNWGSNHNCGRLTNNMRIVHLLNNVYISKHKNQNSCASYYYLSVLPFCQ